MRTAAAALELPVTDGVLNYVRRLEGRAYTYTFEPPAGMPWSNLVNDPRTMPVHDIRPAAGDVGLDREGFALLRDPTDVRDFWDEAELRARYYPLAERLVQEQTGAARVVIFDHTLRRHLRNQQDRVPGVPRQPASRVHNDYTFKSAPQRVRDLMGGEAEALLEKRYAFINVWRPTKGPVLDSPLAICDARSSSLADFIPSDLIYPDRRGEIYTVAHNPAHRWCYASRMQPEEALLIKCFDSAAGVARFVAHSAFVDPDTPHDAPGRESVELRTIAFFD
jgi:hypothetical protein